MTTTDPQHEMFDLYDASGQPLGTSKPRGEVHRDGDWHRSLHLWIWGVDAGEPFVVFQRRSMTKDTWPGVLDVAVGGHFRSGESLAETMREAREEIELALEMSQLTRIGRRFNSWRTETFHDSEINEVYAVRSDRQLGEYRLHPEEVDSLVRINLAAALDLYRGAARSIVGLELPRGRHETKAVELTVPDFVDTGDDYPLQALEAIQQLSTGTPPGEFLIRS